MVTTLTHTAANQSIQGITTRHVIANSLSVATERESRESAAGGRPARPISNRGFVVPDAAMPGPLTRFSRYEDEEGSAGGDSMEDHEAQNQDRI